MLHSAEEDGIEVNQDYKLKVAKVPYRHQPKVYLNMEEIELIRSVEIETFSRLDKIRDIALLGLFTGLRYSDLSRIGSNNLSKLESGKEVLIIRTIKTKQFVTIPMNQIVKDIFVKYDGDPPSLSEQKFNTYFKELCKVAKLNTAVFRIEDDKEVRYEKADLVSSHICRRSFATNSFKSGIHPKYIMAITGHTSMKQFMEYICIDDTEAVEIVSENPFFK